MHTRSYLAFILLCLLTLNACVLGLDQRRYFDRTQALAFFSQNRSAFDHAAEAWYQNHSRDNFLFNRWEDGRFYWNLAAFQCSGGRCRVHTGNGQRSGLLPFATAAHLACVQPQDLRHWMDTASQLQLDGISTIGTALPVTQQYLEIRMRGSSRTPYGLLYIPSGHTAASRLLIQPDGKVPNGFTLIQPLGDHWAYFEGRS